MRHEIEALRPIAHPRGPRQVIDGDAIDPGFGEPPHELLIKGMQATRVRYHDDAGTGWRSGSSGVGTEAGPVGRGENQTVCVGGTALDGRQRGPGAV